MGQFLSMSCVVRGREDAVVEALRELAEENDGSLEPVDLSIEDKGCLVVSQDVGGVTILYPSDFFSWDNASQFLSDRLETPVFSFHIHDSDLWMYSLFEDGELVDQFNPVPDYWRPIDENERRSWQGNAVEVARRVPGLKAAEIARYLVPWGDDVLEATEPTKAYPTDEHSYGDDWQLTDFMGKLGFDLPIDEAEAVRGVTYRLRSKAGGAG
jgi:hypothetical protein